MKKRTDQLEKKYQEYLKLCLPAFSEKVILIETANWLIVENKFPYDLLWNVHHLLIPKSLKQCPTNEEALELMDIFVLFQTDCTYDEITLNCTGRSVPSVFHIHLLKDRK